MMALKLTLLAGILSIGLVSAQDPTAQFRVDKLEVNTVPGNPYFDDWSVEIFNSGESVSFKTPVKKDLPDSIMLKAEVLFADSPLPELDISICEGFEDLTYGQDIVSYGIPKGVFPTACPVKPGANFEISKYKFPNSKIPPGLPDGSVVADISIYEPGKDAYITIYFEGTLSHKLPGLGR